MRAALFKTSFLLVVPVGILLGCGGGSSEAVAPGTGGTSSSGGKSSGTGGTVSSGGVSSSGGAASGGTTSGTGGTTSGIGGTISGTGGATSGTGGATKGTGGATKGTGGATSGAGGATSGSGGTTTSGAGGTTKGAGGITSGAGGITSGAGGTTSGAGGTTRATGGATGSGTGGATGSGTGGTTGTSSGYPIGNPAVPSAGCGKALPSTYKAGTDTTFKNMTSAGLSREYIVYIPTGYDSSKPYKLLFAWHCMGSSDTGAVQSGYYGAKQNDTGKTTILVAPQGYTDGSPWRSDDKDHTFFDDMLKLFKSDLCIDESRVFSIGFSFGGMETYSVSVDRQKDLRAGVGIASANYNIYVPKTKTHLPIAWMQTTGMGDCTCPWVRGQSACGGTLSTTDGAKFIAIEHGTDNGCTVPNPIPTWTSGNHLCVDFTGCKPEYPTKVCTFNGGHTDNASDSGGGGNWIYSEAWKFFSQF